MKYWISVVDHGGKCKDWLGAWTYLVDQWPEIRTELGYVERGREVTLVVETDKLAAFIECLAPAIEVTVLGVE